ncbi:MAG: hypothetical protein M1816_007633 [Peltula sp. TS41687]|nr:MAG: hypothetical protein M1816_007633 [Peltula sp. TS41687]
MSSAVAELEVALQGMLALKPPGVSGSKISTITALCTANVQSESVLIQKIFTHFKRVPSTHKLGVLYVLDSVTRQWVDHARKAGQAMDATAVDGTYQAGVNRVTELLPILMTDIIQHAPEDQKEKIRKLVDIWERGSTFPAAMLQSFKDKLNAPSSKIYPILIHAQSTTPPGSPGRDSRPTDPPASGASAPNTSAILAALASMAKQASAAPPANPINAFAQENTNGIPSMQNPVPQETPAPVTQASVFPPTMPAMSLPFFGAGMVSQAPLAPVTQAPVFPGAMPAFSAPAMPQPQPGADALQQQVLLIQFLMQQGIPQDQWGAIMQALSTGGLGGAGMTPQAGFPNFYPPSRDTQMRSPPPPTGRYQQRDRSRSPQGWRNQSPPRRRDSPTYGDYDNHGDPYDRRGGRGRGGRGRDNDYRQRSPQGNRRGRSPGTPDRYNLPPGGPKWVDYDPTVGKDSIKVLSRTLFVGGVTTSESDLRSIFSRFGTVQTCIVNTEKRHAFVKMISRADALAAKQGMESYKPEGLQLRTRWGVGFGPRDCSDYQTGISVIPIDRLTDADRKWMLTAEYGGSGGKPIEGGLVVEEPDIEIGAGVSSKAISRRMVTDQGGKSGPRSSRPAQDGNRYRRDERDGSDGREREPANAVGGGTAPVPGFGGFSFPTLPNGMPIFPPGFMLPGGLPQQPPPPGQN